MTNKFLGIDGCKAGWAVVEISLSHNLESWEFAISPTMADVYEKYFKAHPIAKPDSSPKATRRQYLNLLPALPF